MDIGTGLAQMGDAFANAMEEYHKRHVAYDTADQMATKLSQLGISPNGQLTVVTDQGGKSTGVQPLLDPKAVEMFRARNSSERDKAAGALEALSRVGINLINQNAGAMNQAQLQRQQQITTQSAESFPLEQKHREQAIARNQQIISGNDKIDVPGFGPMTPSQYSQHVARMQRQKILSEKTEPIRTFENKLQSDYGFGIQDVLNAAQGTFSNKAGVQFKGVPFVDQQGNEMSAEDAAKSPDKAFAVIGPNKSTIPLSEWNKILPKAKNMAVQWEKFKPEQDKQMVQKQQAQAILDKLQGKDAATFTDQDKQAMQWAQSVLGQ